jgi:hypothetical protein
MKATVVPIDVLSRRRFFQIRKASSVCSTPAKESVDTTRCQKTETLTEWRSNEYATLRFTSVVRYGRHCSVMENSPRRCNFSSFVRVASAEMHRSVASPRCFLDSAGLSRSFDSLIYNSRSSKQYVPMPWKISRTAKGLLESFGVTDTFSKRRTVSRTPNRNTC